MGRTDGRWFAFFAVQAVAVALEDVLRPYLWDGMNSCLGGIAPIVRWAYTLSYLLLSGSYLFFNPVRDSGLVEIAT